MRIIIAEPPSFVRLPPRSSGIGLPYMYISRCGSSLEGELLHEQVHVLVDLEAVQIVGVALQPHQEAAERHVRRSAMDKRNMARALANDDALSIRQKRGGHICMQDWGIYFGGFIVSLKASGLYFIMPQCGNSFVIRLIEPLWVGGWSYFARRCMHLAMDEVEFDGFKKKVRITE